MDRSGRSSFRRENVSQVRTERTTRSPARFDSDDPLEISMGTLSKSADGRQATYETRVAMQRELDTARTQLRGSERQNDEMRRQSVASREEAALHRTENLRLQDELRNNRARLNAAMDAQEELLQKNAQKQDQLIELQGANAALRDEVNAKTALANFLQEHNNQIEAELMDLKQRAQANERNMEARAMAMADEVSALRNRAAASDAENESLRAQVESLRLELRRKEDEIVRMDREVGNLERERALVRDELRSSASRLAAVQAEHDDLRLGLQQREDQLRILRTSESILQDQLLAKENAIHQVQLENGRLANDCLQLKTSSSQIESQLSSKLQAHKEREKLLARDLKHLHRYVGKREMDILDLAEQLEAPRDSTLSRSRTTSTSRAQPSYSREREESERLEGLARNRLRKSLGYEL